MSSIWTQGHPIKIIVGHYGSGKTEIALAAAMSVRKANQPSAVVDLDIVNPFFRSAEQRDVLTTAGVELFAPDFALSAADIPVLGAEILSVFERPNLRVFFDVGGDDTGATALGRFLPQFQRHGYEMMVVVNPLRPRTGTVEAAKEMLERIEYRARLKATHLIDNTNLGDETTPDILSQGQKMVERLSKEVHLPVFCRARVLPEKGAFQIERHLKPEWL